LEESIKRTGKLIQRPNDDRDCWLCAYQSEIYPDDELVVEPVTVLSPPSSSSLSSLPNPNSSSIRTLVASSAFVHSSSAFVTVMSVHRFCSSTKSTTDRIASPSSFLYATRPEVMDELEDPDDDDVELLMVVLLSDDEVMLPRRRRDRLGIFSDGNVVTTGRGPGQPPGGAGGPLGRIPAMGWPG
jgi:hypothetical protein